MLLNQQDIRPRYVVIQNIAYMQAEWYPAEIYIWYMIGVYLYEVPILVQVMICCLYYLNQCFKIQGHQQIEAETKWTLFRRRHFQMHFLNENVWIPIKISLKFVPRGPINKIPALVQIMAWRRPGDKPLSGSMVVRLPTHIIITPPQSLNLKAVSREMRPEPPIN